VSESADTAAAIAAGRAVLGIELGSTRIKAVLVDEAGLAIAGGSHEWANRLVDGVWTYDLADVEAGLRSCYADLSRTVRETHGVELTRIAGLGISAMMHGYLAFDAEGAQLTAFRTWRNTSTGQASRQLTEAFGYNIPQRWSIAHLYQAILNGEEHVGRVARITTLAGWVHGRLTGRHVLGVGDASGMFPIDPATGTYDTSMLATFGDLVADRGFDWRLADILPRVLTAGEGAGELTAEGAHLLDPTGTLQPGAPLCPPEGDAGTGMVATNSLRPRTGNVSAGTSIFAMVVLEGPLKKVHEELDMVTTPDGAPVAMAHCNNGTSDLDAWVGLLDETLRIGGVELDRTELFVRLFGAALEGDPDAGGVVAYNYLSGEPITATTEGRPLLLRSPNARFSLANLMRAHLYAVFGTLRLGMDILLTDEGVGLDSLYAHGGLFKTAGVAQRFLAASLDTPVTVGELAGEGGAWGMALLAAYASVSDRGETLPDWLDRVVFDGADLSTLAPRPEDVAGFEAYLTRYGAGLAAERAAAEAHELR